jgi:Fe-S-cluster containining protein
MEKILWWDKGVRFECQGSGKCCVSRGRYGFVYMEAEDRRRMARALKMAPAAFTRKYCEKTNGHWHLKAEGRECRFLEGTRCSVYRARPKQCRTWPFWPEHMGAKTWSREIAAFCPGIGKGRLYSKEEIRARLKRHDSD